MSARKVLVALLAVGLAQGAAASSLLEIYRESLASDARLLRAEAEAAIFQAREDQSRGRLLPQVGIQAVRTRTARDTSTATGTDLPREVYNGERVSASLNQVLFDKSAWEGWRAASKEAEEYLARLAEIRGEVAVDVVNRYTAVLAAEDNLAFVRAELAAAERQLAQAEARHQRQLAAVTDVLALRARVDLLRSRELDAQNEVAMAREQLAEVLGRPVDEPFPTLRESLVVDWQPGSLEDWTRRALAANRELAAARHAVEAASKRVKEAAGQHWPTLTLALSALESDIGYDNVQNPQYETYVAALNFNLPLYTGGQTSARVDEARARLRYALQQLAATDRQVRREVREAFLNARSAIQRVAATAQAVVSAEQSFAAQQKGYEYGTVTVVDVLTAAETLYQARRDHRQAWYDLMAARTALFQVAGALTEAEIAHIDRWLESPAAETAWTSGNG
ncbi:MAG: channel protein TolC [Porticoccaceae bacterium]|nr:MAG: channel protein TolC [Porticoccaceae bacterium]